LCRTRDRECASRLTWKSHHFMASKNPHQRLVIKSSSLASPSALAFSDAARTTRPGKFRARPFRMITRPYSRRARIHLHPRRSFRYRMSSPSYADASFQTPRRPILDALTDLPRRIHEFTSIPPPTTVTHPVSGSLRDRRGRSARISRICKIACLRSAEVCLPRY